MKINFVGSAPDGCYLYRCQNPINYSKHDVRGDIDLYKEGWEVRPDILEADIAIFHRPKDDQRLQMMRMLKQRGIMIGYDNDDTWEVSPSHPLYGHINTDKHEECLQEADFVTVSTEFLAKEYRKHNENVYVIPNLIDFNLYPEPKGQLNEKKRILISGSVIRCNDGFNFWNVLKKLEKRKDVQLVVFGNHNKFNGLKAEYHDFIKTVDYPQKLKDLQIDICLIPREENYFNRAKSNCKYLEMAASKIPVIAQSFNIKDSPYDLTEAPMRLATNNWIEIIDSMDNREEMQEKAYDWVKKNYNANLNIFDEVIEKVWNT